MKNPFATLVVLATLSFTVVASRAQTPPPADPAASNPAANFGAQPAEPPPVVNPAVATDLAAPQVEPPKAESVQPTEPSAPKKPAKPAAKKPPGTPFSGNLEAVDKAAMTLTVAGKSNSRTIQITSHTRFTRDGKPATFGDAVPGEEVAGYTKKAKDGNVEALSIRYGAKAVTGPKPAASKPAKSTSAKKKAKPAVPPVATPAAPATIQPAAPPTPAVPTQ